MSLSGSARSARGRRLTDARGRSVALLELPATRPGGRPAAISPRTRRAIVREAGVGLTGTGRLLVLVGLLLLAVVLLGHALSVTWGLVTGARPQLGHLAGDGTPLAYLWITPFVIWMAMCRPHVSRLGRALLRRRRCPHCGRDLRGLPAEAEDHATVCPECRCAWRLDETEPSQP